MAIDLSPTGIRRSAEPSDRDALVRAFTAWTGSLTIADELAQETLYAAWTSTRQPETDQEWRPWLFGVARNILLRWRRDQAKHGRRIASAPESEYHLLAAAADDDIDALLSRKDIVELLDAALSRLPRETRQALLLKYIDDLPQVEIAARMGMHEKALEGRLHRGKKAMHRHLITERADSAVLLGLVSEPDTWVETDIWCPVCGKSHLHGRWYESGDLRLDCLSCDNWFRPGERSHMFSTEAASQGLPPPFDLNRRPSFQVAMDMVSDRLRWRFEEGINSTYDCPRCGGTIEVRVLDDPRYEELMICPDVHFGCATCGYSDGCSWLPGVSFYHPEMIVWEERARADSPAAIQVCGDRWAAISGDAVGSRRW